MSLLNNQRKADIISGIYQDLEEILMKNIVRHIKDYGKPIDSDDWQLQKLAEIGKLNKENIKLIVQQSGIANSEAELLLFEASQEAIKQLEPGLQKAMRDGLLHNAKPVEKSKNIKRVIDTLQKQATDTLNLCNTKMLYKAREVYKSLVQNICFTAKEIEKKQEFLDTMNEHAVNVVTGAVSRTQAVKDCIKQFNEKGIPAFVDKAGREWTPEAYVNMCMRNTARNVADEVQSERCKEYGCNLIEISAHSGARPKCAKDQGKIFDLNNKTGYTEDARGNKIRYYAWNTSSYGDPDGVLGINCGHHKYPFIPGVNIQRYFPIDEEENDKLYKATQVQRALERDVRKQKRECMLYKELGDDEAFEKSAVKLKSKEAKLKHYVNNNDGLHRRKDREQVVGFDKSVSSKAISANRKNKSRIAVKSIASLGENDIIVVDAKPGTAKYRKLKKQAIIKRGISEKKPIFTNDLFGKYASKIPKKDGYYDVIMHGAPKTVEFFGERTDAKTIAEIIKKRKDYNKESVRLLSCSTGKGEECFAQRLSDELKVEVEAPNDTIWAFNDGSYTIGKSQYSNTGKMIKFTPRKK